MIKFIYQVEASEETVNPLGFSFYSIHFGFLFVIHDDSIWTSKEEFIKSYELQQKRKTTPLIKLEEFTDLIPKDWNKVKFKQV